MGPRVQILRKVMMFVRVLLYCVLLSVNCTALPMDWFSIQRALLKKVCLKFEDAFVITCVANVMEVKVLYVQQDLRYEISGYWRFNV
jgi:hypothetical protein